MRDAAKDIALLMGLRLARDEDRSLPYARSLAAKRLGLNDDRHAGRVLRRLVEADVVYVDENATDTNGVRMRTTCYLPGPRSPVDVLPARPLTVEADLRSNGEVDEREEVGDDVPVRQAVADDGREVVEDDGLPVAPRDRAGDAGNGHTANRTPTGERIA
jgi:hypothetical protein